MHVQRCTPLDLDVHLYKEPRSITFLVKKGRLKKNPDPPLTPYLQHSGLGSKIRREFMDTMWGYPEDFILDNNKPDVRKMKEEYRHLARWNGIEI